MTTLARAIWLEALYQLQCENLLEHGIKPRTRNDFAEAMKEEEI